jgi:hypothetical protein
MLRGSMGDDRDVMPPRDIHHPDDVTLVARPHKRPMPGKNRGGCQPTRRVVIRDPPDPRRVVIRVPPDPAAS